MTMIDIARIEQPAHGKKMGKVFTDQGIELHCWPDKLAQLQAGAQAEVEIAEEEFNGRPFRKITKVKPRKNGNAESQGRPPVSANAPSDAEGAFVREILAIGLRSGAVAFDEKAIRSAIATLRRLWRE